MHKVMMGHPSILCVLCNGSSEVLMIKYYFHVPHSLLMLVTAQTGLQSTVAVVWPSPNAFLFNCFYFLTLACFTARVAVSCIIKIENIYFMRFSFFKRNLFFTVLEHSVLIINSNLCLELWRSHHRKGCDLHRPK